MLRTVVSALIVVVACSPQSAHSQRPSFGPLTFEEGGPINRMSYTPMMESADVVPEGVVGTTLYLGLANIFEHDSTDTHLIFVDMERLTTAATVRWGVATGLEVGGRLTMETRSGGFLDSSVRWYHELLGFGQANRERFPEEGYRYILSDGGSTVFVEAGPQSLGLEDVRLFAKWRVARSENERNVLSLRAVTRIPTRENLAGEERTDVGLMALGRVGLGAWYVHGMLGASTVRAAKVIEPVLNAPSLFFSFALERSLGANMAGIFQYQVSSPALQGFDNRELDWPLSNIIFGLAGRFNDRWSWDASFQEDMPADAPAIDFTVGVRLTYLWH